jgi:hypothetical protein
VVWNLIPQSATELPASPSWAQAWVAVPVPTETSTSCPSSQRAADGCAPKHFEKLSEESFCELGLDERSPRPFAFRTWLGLDERSPFAFRI